MAPTTVIGTARPRVGGWLPKKASIPGGIFLSAWGFFPKSQRVRDLTNGNQKPMMAMPKTVEDYPISMRLQ